MKLWVAPWKVPAPHNQTVSAKTGGSLFFAAFSVWRNRWVLLHNGREEEIEPPEFYRCTAEHFAANVIPGAVPPPKLDKPAPRIRKQRKPAQLGLELSIPQGSANLGG